MAQKVILSKVWCDEHMAECWQAYNTSSGKVTHVDSFTAATETLKEYGYVYTGHNSGQYEYTRRASQPLALDWQMMIETREQAEIIQGW